MEDLTPLEKMLLKGWERGALKAQYQQMSRDELIQWFRTEKARRQQKKEKALTNSAVNSKAVLKK